MSDVKLGKGYKSAKVIYGGRGGVRITRKVSVPKEIVEQLPDEWTDNLVFYHNRGVSKYERPFTNEFGTFFQSFGSSAYNPLGRNARFIPHDGSPIIEEKKWGYVTWDASRQRKAVPGWCGIARRIRHPDTCVRFNLWNPDRGRTAKFYDSLPLGTDVRPILQAQGYDLEGKPYTKHLSRR